MVDYQEEYREISLVDVFAYLVKKFWIICICALIGAAIGIGYNYHKIHTAASIEKYERELQVYNEKLSNLEDSVAHLRVLKEAQISSNAENPIMDLDGKDVYKTTITFRVSSSDGSFFVNNAGTVIYPNTDRVIAFWNSMDLAGTLGSSYKNEYLRKLVTLSIVSAPSEFLSLTVWGSSIERMDDVSQKLMKAITQYCNSIGNVVIDNEVKQNELSSSTYIHEIIKANTDAVYDYEKQITELIDGTDGIEVLKKQKPHQGGFAKSAFIGFLVAGIIIVGVFCCIFAFSDIVSNSSDASNRLKVPVLGALYSDNGLFDKFARAVLHERTWKNTEEAEQWFTENINKAVIPGNSKIALLYSGTDKHALIKLDRAKDLVSKKGYVVTIINNAYQNPETNRVIENSDVIVLFEKQFKSRWINLNSIVETSNRFGKKTVGIIIC